MNFDSKGYLLTPDGGPQLWFLDTRMNIKAGRRTDRRCAHPHRVVRAGLVRPASARP